MDPGIAKLIERTRARRNEIKESVTSDGSPLPSERDRSPLKELRSNRGHERESSPSKKSDSSPIKKKTVTVVLPDSPSNTVKRLLSRDSLENNVQQLISRDSPGKSVTTTVSTRVSPGKGGATTITKTVITEKEEKYEKKEIISFSGNREVLETLGDKLEKLDDEVFKSEKNILKPMKQKENQESFSKTGKENLSSKELCGSPIKVTEDVTPTNTPIMVEGDLQSSRKARMANLANKFKNIDQDSPLSMPEHIQLPKPATKPSPIPPSPPKHPPVKTDHIRNRSVSPVKSAHQFLGSSQLPKTVRTVSPTKPPLLPPSNHDASFVTSLKAQGFQETDSRSRLVYNFENQRDQSPSPTRNVSPVRGNIFLQQDRCNVSPPRERGRSGVKKSALINKGSNGVSSDGPEVGFRTQSPDKQPSRNLSPSKSSIGDQSSTKQPVRNPSPSKQPVRNQSPSKEPVRNPSPSKQPVRNQSPSKPHPMQFITPQTEPPVAPSGPPKPSRTFQTNLQPHKAETRLLPIKTDDRVDSPVMKSVSEKRNIFESQATTTPETDKPDPALMSISQRKALFDKKGSAPTPVARFGESVTPAMLQKNKAEEVGMTPSEAWKRKRALSPSKQGARSTPVVERPTPVVERMTPAVVRRPEPSSTPVVRHAEPNSTPVVREPGTETPSTPSLGRKTEEMQRKLFTKQDWRENTIAQKVSQEKEAEMNLLLNRYNHLKSSSTSQSVDKTSAPAPREETSSPPPPPPPPPTSSAEKYYPGVNSVKRVKVSPPKSGGLYPTIDYESDTLGSRAESVMSTDTLNSSFESCITTTASEAPSLGTQIVSMTRQQQEQELCTIEENNDSMETDDGEGMTDSMLDAAMDDDVEDEEDDDDYDDHPTPPKMMKTSTSSSGSSDHMERSESTTSWEFHTPRPGRAKDDDKFKTPLISVTGDSPATPQPTLEGEDGPLLHTVSFYRKQKPANVTPVQRIVITPRVGGEEGPPEVTESPRATITQRIHQLQEDANSQMPVIQQASSALNLCRSTKEFFGSSEQVEGERLLLVATHKRSEALTEIQRLKTEGGIGADPRREEQSSSVRGTVSVCGVTLGLKKEFVEQLKSGEGGDFIHYFVCLVKCAGQVIATQMVSTSEGLEGASLHFPNLINFRDLTKDFSINLEVYGLQTRREVMGHEAKYHIKKGGKSTFNLTPMRKMNKTESRLTRPDVSSPGGPHTIRTSSFARVGQAVVTIDSLQRKDWRLQSVPPISPLNGAINFKLNCTSESQVSKRGFLTMFDDVSGFGAWHRRWFVLEGHTLSFWKYPENETNNEPIGRLDLVQCITSTVSLCPREICSRLHTMLLETSRPATREDKESLVVVRKGRDTTVLRHLLSADSRPERVAWCEIFNRALDNIRAWDVMRPRSGSESSLGSVDTVTSSQSTDIW